MGSTRPPRPPRPPWRRTPDAGPDARRRAVGRPRAGSVYPALQLLEDESLISAAAGEDRKRNYTLTDEGRAYVQAHADELRASWDAVTGSVDDAAVQLHNLARNVAMATVQVA